MATNTTDEALSPIVALHGLVTPTTGNLQFSVTTPCSRVRMSHASVMLASGTQ